MDRNLFVKRLWLAQKTRQLSGKAYLVGRAMLRRAGRQGALWPSRACLADDVGCSPSTVERATARMRELGLLVWETRRVRWNKMASNLYRLVTLTIERKEESALSLPAVRMTNGSLPPSLAAALSRLGKALGVSEDAVMPWLAPNRARSA